MTRIQLSHAPEVFAGWSRMEGSYFLQVFAGDADDNVLFDVGDILNPIREIPELRQQASAWAAYLTPVICATLRSHKAAQAGNVELDMSGGE